jgi:hypothetical protein
MGKRDFGKRENKKPKKDIKKPIVNMVPPTVVPTVEVIKKKRKYEDEESGEE